MIPPLVSIITPVYNMAQYVTDMIESVFRQSYPEVELIIVDDGSTDATAAVIEQYLEGGRIQYLKQANDGIARARNKGFAHCRGAYIAFLDADDIALPERIAEQVKFLEANPRYGVVYSRFQSFAAGRPDQLYSYNRVFYSGDILEPLLSAAFINPSTVLMRRSVFEEAGGFNSDLREGEDWELWRRLAYRGVQFYFMDRVLVHTRLHPNSLSGFHNQARMKKTDLRTFQQFFNQMTEEERRRYRADHVTRRLKVKLAIAHLLHGRRRNFQFWLRASGAPYWRFLWLAGLLPAPLAAAIVKTLWGWKQRRLFVKIT